MRLAAWFGPFPVDHMVFLAAQLMVVHEEIFQLSKEPLAEILQVFYIRKAVVSLFNRDDTDTRRCARGLSSFLVLPQLCRSFCTSADSRMETPSRRVKLFLTQKCFGRGRTRIFFGYPFTFR